MLAALPLRRRLLPCLLLLIVPVSTTLVNMTIDDTDGDPIGDPILTFSPSGQWYPGQTCPTCSVHSGNTSSTIDVSQVFDGTWHESTFVPGVPGDPNNIVNVTYTGSAVYVYNIIANEIPSATTLTQVNFFVDGVFVGNYEHAPQSTGPTFAYGVLVYANVSIPYGRHNFIMAAQGPNTSLILFDYMMYTQDRPPTSLDGSSSTDSISSPSSASSLRATSTSTSGSSKSSRPPVGAIVGGAVGAVVGLAIVAWIVLLCLRARRPTGPGARIPSPAAEKPDPFVFDMAQRQRRMPRAPIVPDLRFGRSRLPGMSRGPGSTTTTDASSHGHRPRLPRMSPAEAAAYASRLEALEAHVRALEAQEQQLSPGPGPGTATSESGSRSHSVGPGWLTRPGALSQGSTPWTWRSRSGSRSRSGRSRANVNADAASASGADLQEELASLRSEIAALRGVLAQDQDQLPFPGGLDVRVDSAPSYVS
ncbi:hypothetical protein V8D89_009997 [Ganoderma adspersum]